MALSLQQGLVDRHLPGSEHRTSREFQMSGRANRRAYVHLPQKSCDYTHAHTLASQPERGVAEVGERRRPHV